MREQPWRVALARKLPSVARRLRTVDAAADGRVFLATDAVVSSLHCAAVLNLSRCHVHHAPAPPPFRAAPPPRGARAPAVAHQFVCVNQQQQLRKDTLLNFTDVVSLAVLHCGFVAVVFGDGAFHLFGRRAHDGNEGGWGGAWAAWTHFPVSLAPPADVKCVCAATVLAPSSTGAQTDPAVVRALVVARQSGVFVYDESALESAQQQAVAHVMCLTTAWSNVMATCDAVQVLGRAQFVTLVAVAHEHGKLALHAVSAAAHSAQRSFTHSLVWDAELSAPVSSLSFCTTSARKATISLAVAVGNDLVLVEWGDGCALQADQWACPAVRRVQHAHESLLSAALVVADGSVVSAGMDGSLLQWRIEGADGREAQRASARSSVILQQDEDAVEPVMSVAATLNNVCVHVLTTNLRSRTEIGEPSKGNIRKYLGSGRRSAISLMTMGVGHNVGALDEAIGKSMERFLSAAWIGRGISMWDVEVLVSDGDMVASGLAQKLWQRYEWLLAQHEHVEGGREQDARQRARWRRVQRARVLLWLGRVLERGGLRRVDDAERVRTVSAALRSWLLCVHFDRCVGDVLRHDEWVRRFGDADFRALHGMCALVSCCAAAACDAEDMRRRAAAARVLVARWERGGGRAAAWCPLCECEGARRELRGGDGSGGDGSGGDGSGGDGRGGGGGDGGGGDGAEVLRCGAGDAFARCVKSATAVTDAVALQCAGCGARAVARHFAWIGGGDRCALCGCQLGHGGVESV